MFNSTATEAALLVDSPPSHIKKTAGESGTVPFGARSVLKVPTAVALARYHRRPHFDCSILEARLLVEVVSLDRSGCD